MVVVFNMPTGRRRIPEAYKQEERHTASTRTRTISIPKHITGTKQEAYQQHRDRKKEHIRNTQTETRSIPAATNRQKTEAYQKHSDRRKHTKSIQTGRRSYQEHGES